MNRPCLVGGRVFLTGLTLLLSIRSAAAQQDLSQARILDAINIGRRHLISQQLADGSWEGAGLGAFKTGVTGLAVLSLINAGQEIDSQPVQKGLDYLRGIKEPSQTYDISMMLMALAAAKDSPADISRIHSLAALLEQGQIKKGAGIGCWGYSVNRGQIDSGDRSNGQFAILALRDAAEAGANISQDTWKRARSHWLRYQNPNDGGWGYRNEDRRSIGSMTVAGIATLIITSSMISDPNELDANGQPNCCLPVDPDEPLERGIAWLERNFSVRQNPLGGQWFLYYIYGLERAGRLSGRRLFGQFDWYREGARYLLDIQSARGSWKGVGPGESQTMVGTSLALLFLSKGLSPVLINKLKFGPRAAGRPNDVIDDNWNRHPHDAANITKLISGLPRWPRLVTAQNVDLDFIPVDGGSSILKQAPILLLTGSNNPRALIRDDQVGLLREYLDRGGFIFAVRNCDSTEFDEGFQELVEALYPGGEATLDDLPVDHPVYRAEYPLDPETVRLMGVDAGCRTTIIYSPEDLGCLWEKWMRVDPPERPNSLKIQITRATRIGVNVIAYVTGREPPLKITDEDDLLAGSDQLDRVERGLLQIAKLRHSGGWDTAPRAVRNLLNALNRTAGVETSTVIRNLFAADRTLIRYPLIYMHGRHPFSFNRQERTQLQQYLERGGVLLADACCGSRMFDDSFRDFCQQMFPEQSLQRIPVDHSLFNRPAGFGHSIRQVTRRVPVDPLNGGNQPIEARVDTGEPFLEGIEIEGRLAIIYSKYDISCALERQASGSCSGYIFDDALKLAVNAVLYAMTQDVKYRTWLDQSETPN